MRLDGRGTGISVSLTSGTPLRVSGTVGRPTVCTSSRYLVYLKAQAGFWSEASKFEVWSRSPDGQSIPLAFSLQPLGRTWQLELPCLFSPSFSFCFSFSFSDSGSDPLTLGGSSKGRPLGFGVGCPSPDSQKGLINAPLLSHLRLSASMISHQGRIRGHE